jgi:hypothetical protein
LEQWRDFLLPYHLIVIQARAALFSSEGTTRAARQCGRHKLDSPAARRGEATTHAHNHWFAMPERGGGGGQSATATARSP